MLPPRSPRARVRSVLAVFPLMAVVLLGCGGDETPAGPGAADTGASDVPAADGAAGPADGGCTTAADCPTATGPCAQAACVAGACQALPASGIWCDDGDPCTAGDVCQQGQCQAGVDVCECRGSDDCADDGDLCNGVPYCNTQKVPYRCQPLPGATVVCDTSGDAACSQAKCAPATGKCEPANRIDGSLCDDGLPCTVDTTCLQGQCQGGLALCSCLTNADCADDADLCNGKPYCDKSGVPFACKINPATVVTCPTGQDTQCKKALCDPATGGCALAALADGIPCDADGQPCTVGDHCVAGQCVPGTDTCLCASDLDCLAKDDGNLCNGKLFCNKASGKCELNPATVVSCPSVDDTACQQNQCQPKTGLCQLTPINDAKPCDDGQPCTVGDVCANGQCLAGTNTCSCASDAACAAQDDGNLCNGQLFCNKAKTPAVCELNPATVVTCPSVDDTGCQKTGCNPKSGQCEVQLAADNTACDADGNACTVGDVCQGGQCVPGANVCVCQSNADCSAGEDGDLCNGTLYCNKALDKPACEVNPATLVQCPTVDDGPCGQSLCQPKTGKCAFVHLNSGKLCDDGNPCTLGETCQGGACTAGANDCECQVNADCAAHEDGNLCNGTLYCDKSGAKPKCVVNPATVTVCPGLAGNACVLNTCNPVSGKCQIAAVNQDQPCSDGSLCTTKDTCKAGQCVGQPVACDDGDACTLDACLPAQGCQNTKAKCDDGIACSLDACDAQTGQCSHSIAAMEAKPCIGDGDGCTANDVCKQGICVVGAKVDCAGQAGECQSAACQSTGTHTYQCIVSAKGEGAPCAVGGCKVGGTCQAGKCQGATKDQLFVLEQAVAGKDAELRAVAALAEGGVVTGGVQAALSGPAQYAAAAAWLQRLDATGAVMWQKVLPSDLAGPEVGIAALLALDGGGLVAAGALATAKTGQHLEILRLDGQGQVLWQKGFGQADAGDEAAWGLDRRADGGVLVAGSRQIVGGDRQGWLLHVSPSGQLVWQVLLGGSGHDELRGVVALPDGGALAHGWTESLSGVRAGWAVRVDAQGKALWQRGYGLAQDQRFEAGRRAGDGVLLAGWRQPATARQPWLVRLDQAGDVVWQRQPGLAAEIRALVEQPGGAWVVAGASNPTGAQRDAWLQGTDSLGNPQWDGAHDSGGDDVALGLARHADGGLAVVGRRGAAPAGQGLYLRSDAWGHTSCAAAGTCVAKATAACDDGQACTVDRCEGGSGCVHPSGAGQACALDDGCHPEGACTAQGSCGPGEQAQVFTQAYDVPAFKELAGVARATDGSLLGVGHTATSGLPPWRLLRWSSAGVLELDKTLAGDLTHPIGDVVALAGGRFALTAAHDEKLTVRAFEADGKQAWVSTPNCIPCTGVAIARADGQDAVVVAARVHSTAPNLIWLGRHAVFDGQQQMSGFVPYNDIGEPVRIRLAPAPDGTVLLTVTHDTGGGTSQAYVLRVNEAVKTTWQADTKFFASNTTRLNDVALLTSGTIVVGDGKDDLGIRQVGVVRRGPTDDVVWKWVSSGTSHRQGLGLLPLPDGHFALAGTIQQGSTQAFWLARLDGNGQLQWQQTLPVAGQTVTPALGTMLLGLPDGGLVLAGSATALGKTVPVLVRTDPWGHASCASAGACASKLLAACADGNGCTVDLCDGKSGCTTQAVPDEVACDDGQACTQTDKCSGGTCKGQPVAGCP